MQRLGKYEILERLGAGGMAVVYRARDSSLDRDVALKVINQRLEEDGEAILKRFLHEAKIAAGLTHPNIVVIYELGVEEGLPYIAMEYLTGCDLLELIRGKATFTLQQKVDIILQIARALEHAHSRGVIHRDIKPGNIRVLENGQAKLVDFGIAKATSANLTRLTQPGTVLGTVAYMSPEQLLGEPPDPASDVFSFGVVFYELLTSRKPFESGDLASLVFKIVHGTPNPFTPDDALLPEGLRGIVLRCLAKPASARYPGFTPIIQDIVSFQRGAQDGPQTRLAPGMFEAARQQAQGSGKAPHEQTSATEAFTAEVRTGERATQPDLSVSPDTSASTQSVLTSPEASEPPDAAEPGASARKVETQTQRPEAVAREPETETQEPEAEAQEPQEEPPTQPRSRLPLVAAGALGLAGVVAAALFWPGAPPDGGDPRPTPRPTASLSTPAAQTTEAPRVAVAAPATETPSQPPATEAPGGQLPATETPGGQLPATETPGGQIPATAAPSSLPPTASPTPTSSPIPSPTDLPSATPSGTSTPSPTPSGTSTPSPTPSDTPSSSPTATLSPTSTHTPVPTPTTGTRVLAGQNKKVEDARNRALLAMKAAEDAKARNRVPAARDRAGAAFSSAEKALAEGKPDQAASQFALAEEIYRQAADFAAKVATAEQMAASSDYSPALGLLEAVFDAYPAPGPATVELRKRLLALRDAVEGPLAKADDSLAHGDVKAAWEALAQLTAEQRKLPQVEEMLSRIEERIGTDKQAPDLQLASPSYATAQPFVLEVAVTDTSGVASVIFHSRCQDEDFFEPRPMEPAGKGRFRASIGPERHKNKPVRYYVEAVDVAGNRGSSGTAKKPLQASPKKP